MKLHEPKQLTDQTPQQSPGRAQFMLQVERAQSDNLNETPEEDQSR